MILFFIFCLTSFFIACSETFEPLQENDTVPMSIYGYLDASADTQWVRVAPIREQLNLPPEKPEMEVTLEHLESGNSWVMNDSLVHIGDGFNVLNSWTTGSVNPGQTYRIDASREDGAGSYATAAIPADFPIPVLQESTDGCLATLQINGVEHLADVQSRWHVLFLYIQEGAISEEERFFTIPHRRNAVRLAEGNYSVSLNTNNERNYILNQLLVPPTLMHVMQRDIFVASAGSDWVEEVGSIDDIIYALPEGFSNVENGVGYLAGIVSKTLSWERCFRQQGGGF